MPTSNPTGAVPSVVNAVLPFLTGTAAGNGLLSCGGVCWRFCDSVFGVDNRDPARASANAKAVGKGFEGTRARANILACEC